MSSKQRVSILPEDQTLGGFAGEGKPVVGTVSNGRFEEFTYPNSIMEPALTFTCDIHVDGADGGDFEAAERWTTGKNAEADAEGNLVTKLPSSSKFGKLIQSLITAGMPRDHVAESAHAKIMDGWTLEFVRSEMAGNFNKGDAKAEGPEKKKPTVVLVSRVVGAPGKAGGGKVTAVAVKQVAAAPKVAEAEADVDSIAATMIAEVLTEAGEQEEDDLRAKVAAKLRKAGDPKQTKAVMTAIAERAKAGTLADLGDETGLFGFNKKSKTYSV